MSKRPTKGEMFLAYGAGVSRVERGQMIIRTSVQHPRSGRLYGVEIRTDEQGKVHSRPHWFMAYLQPIVDAAKGSPVDCADVAEAVHRMKEQWFYGRRDHYTGRLIER